jgi:hypothetical protein
MSNKLSSSTSFFVIAITGLTLLLSACAYGRMYYYIGFINKTGQDLDGVCVYYGEKEAAAAGGLVKTGLATDGPVTLPFPAEAEVRWIENGERHAVKTKLKDVIPKGFTEDEDGTVYFVINQDHTIQAKLIRRGNSAESAWLHELRKGLRPKGEYRLGFVNKTGHDLTVVSAYYGDERVALAGSVKARVKVGYSEPLTAVIPVEAEVRWNENGAPHAVKAKLEGVVPKGFAEGTVYFIINGEGTVEVKPLQWGDREGAIKIMK